MQSAPLLSELFLRLWNHVTPRRRRQFAILLTLMVLGSLAEIISIGAVLPFLGTLTSPEYVFKHDAMQPFVAAFDLRSPQELLLPITLIFVAAALLTGALRLLLLWFNTRLSFATGADLSISIYRRTLYQPYAVHIGRNSSEVINGITGKASNLIHAAILPALTIISSSIMLLMILATMIAVDPLIALAAFGGFLLIYSVVFAISRRRLQIDSQRIAEESTRVIKALQEGLGGIRDVLIDGSQPAYCKIYSDADLPLRRAQGNTIFLGQSPRFVLEALGMILISTLAYFLAVRQDGVAKVIPVLGALALGAQRLLPVLQQGYASWVAIQGGRYSLKDALDLLDQPTAGDLSPPALVKFERVLALQRISFKYGPQLPWVLSDITLTINKGSRVGFIGTTGSGKSTLLDIVMGLLVPTQGRLEIDGAPITAGNCRGWQAHVAHVPQTIFLADCSIEENIAFGIPKDKIDTDRVRRAAAQAQIADIIESWPAKYETNVGERGVRLSGGQRQRIGIARALYKEADIIIFDEATSALDNETEQAVMQAIENLGEELTILIIAHRISTLKGCSEIVELDHGHIRRIGPYLDIVAK